MKASCCLVEIDGVIQRNVFFVRNYAVKWAKFHAGNKPWRVLLVEETECLAEGIGGED